MMFYKLASLLFLLCAVNVLAEKALDKRHTMQHLTRRSELKDCIQDRTEDIFNKRPKNYVASICADQERLGWVLSNPADQRDTLWLQDFDCHYKKFGLVSWTHTISEVNTTLGNCNDMRRTSPQHARAIGLTWFKLPPHTKRERADRRSEQHNVLWNRKSDTRTWMSCHDSFHSALCFVRGSYGYSVYNDSKEEYKLLEEQERKCPTKALWVFDSESKVDCVLLGRSNSFSCWDVDV
ncbi:uncharacterized protein UTRI_02838 [Ustilago trichophora]|uniref:Uncharacterized protein n=1 Tax=Ustilago trichophora TaxID=86804 RepID=A0A5C3ESA6_9BASI|nr:uncharacterized protein UTRI_02838 [Ustilago trichophora]